MAEFAQAQECHVVSLEFEDKTVILTLRAHDKWLYAEAKPSRIKNKRLRSRLQGLLGALEKQEQTDGGALQATKTEPPSKPTSNDAIDSGYASERTDEDSQDGGKEQLEEAFDAEKDLQNWLLASMKDTISELAQKRKACEGEKTLSDWYNADILFFNLESRDHDDTLLTPLLRHDLDGPKHVRDVLTPHIDLPNYIRKLPNVRSYSPEDVTVISESHDLHLHIHPTLVRLPTSGMEKKDKDMDSPQTAFFKLSNTLDPHSVKREIRFLNMMAKHDIYNKGIRAPRLVGVVPTPSSPNSSAQILGFLLTLIPQPARPLIEYMDSSVEESRRIAWAEEAERMVKVLHAHKMVWGDAKADNFVVDKDDKLWMIDFGGSYTPGWIDEELADTVEGDNMGTEKIVNGMKDPDANTLDEEEEAKIDAPKARKRKANATPHHQRKSDVETGNPEISTEKRRKL